MFKTVADLDRLREENAFAVLARATELAAQGRDIINLGIGQPDFPTPNHIVEAGIKALRDGHHGYTPATGIAPLRVAVAADLHRRHGQEVDPGNIVIQPGGKPTMFFAILMFGEPGSEIVYVDPGFPVYRSMIEYRGATPVPIPLREENAFGFTADDVLSRITPATRLIVLNSPGNPCGGVTPKAEMDKLAVGLADHPGVAILSDEIYSCMTYDGLEHATLLAYPHLRDQLILLDGWSKTYAMTGWRIGYGIWPDQLVDKVRKLVVNAHSCVNAPTQYAAIAALEGSQEPVLDMVAEFDRRRQAVVGWLNNLPNIYCATPKGAFYAFPNISATGWQSKPLATALLEDAGIAVIGGPDFGANGEGFIRISYANSVENIERAMQRIGTFLTDNTK